MEIARDFGLVEGVEPKASGGKPRNRKSDGGAASSAAAAAAAAAHVPLTRQAALAAAIKRREAFTLPHRLACGVLITSLGAVRPGDACECCTRLLLANLMGWYEFHPGLSSVRVSHQCRLLHRNSPLRRASADGLGSLSMPPCCPATARSLLLLRPALACWLHL